MKYLISLIIFFNTLIVFSQDYNFKPIWKKGDIKEIQVTIVNKEYEDGVLIEDSTWYNYGSIEVLKENKEFYTIKVLYENQALSLVESLYDMIGDKLKKYKDLELIYSVNKKTAKSELLNWEEASAFMNESFDEISEVFGNEKPEFKSLTKVLFFPLIEAFKSKDNIEDYMSTHIGYLLIPYNNNYQLNEPIVETEKEENPFNPSQEISATITNTLVAANQSNCKIKYDTQLDLSEFMEMMKGMMEGMAKSFGASDSSTTNKMKELDDFEMDMTNIQEIDYNLETTWISKAVNTVTVTTTDPRKGKKNKNIAISTSVIK